MVIDFSKYNVGDVVSCHWCNPCQNRAGFTQKFPADSGSQSWLCGVCGHFGIGSEGQFVVDSWFRLKPSKKD